MKPHVSNHTIRSVWMVSREYEGLAGAGGVKDVCRQLAEALVVHGECRVSVLLPLYGFMDAVQLGFTPLTLPAGLNPMTSDPAGPCTFAVDMDYPDEERRESVSIWGATLRGVSVYLAEADRFIEKLGVYTYSAEEAAQTSWKLTGAGHYDYFAMNILLQKAALALMVLLEERPEVIHCQDGHAATLPAMMREIQGYRHYFRHTGAVVTVHNAGVGYHQDVADLAFAKAITGLPERVIDASLLEASFDPFLAASEYSLLNTVSTNYGRELQETSEDARTGWLGHALLDRGIGLAGITNGINPEDFDPTRPEQLGLAAGFDLLQGDVAGKKTCKLAMLREVSRMRQWEHVEQFGLLSADASLPLFTFIGRLTAQKGVDILLEALSLCAARASTPFQLLVLGSGAPELEEELQQIGGGADAGYSLCFLKGFDPSLANTIYAAGDFFLIPSLYEPCGLTDYIAQLLGNLPIVHHVGGLVKVIDGETGFAYRQHSPTALAAAMGRALTAYGEEPATIARMQQAAVRRIAAHHTWEKVMEAYMVLYRQAIHAAARGE